MNPLDYPGPPATGPLLMHADGVTDLEPGRIEEGLRDHGAAPLHERVPVLAVGSNASPAVVRAKLARAGVGPVLPFLPVSVRHLTVGVSAHVSAGGYLPATPVLAPGAAARVVLSWADGDQLRALDATEPNYHRVEVSARDHPLALRRPGNAPGGVDPGGAGPGWATAPGRFALYVSRWGALISADDPAAGPRAGAARATTGERPWLALTDQHALAARLARHGLDPWASTTAAGAARLLAAAPARRSAAREAFAARGLVRPCGILGHPVGDQGTSPA